MEDWILELPKWKGQMFFSINIVSLLMIIGVIIAGIILCFWGYKYFHTIILIIIGCASGILGINLVETLLVESIYKMIFFVMFIFFGVLFLFFVTNFINNMLSRSHLYNNLVKRLYFIAPLLGSLMVMFLIYFNVYHNIAIVMGIFLILFSLGYLYSKKRVASRRPFYSYDDLCQLKPLKDVREDA